MADMTNTERKVGGAPYRYRFTLEGKSTLDQYMEAAMDAGFYGVDNHPVWPCFTEDHAVWAKWDNGAGAKRLAEREAQRQAGLL